jgi:ElaB/YqjD/DUF883 family membrane-anchored ribosome-binding protein
MTSGDVKDKVKTEVDKVRSELKSRVETVQTRVKERVNNAQAKVQDVEKRVQDAFNSVSGRIQNVGERVRSETTEAGKKVGEVAIGLANQDVVRQWLGAFPLEDWMKTPLAVREELYERLGLPTRGQIEKLEAHLVVLEEKVDAVAKAGDVKSALDDLAHDLKKVRSTLDKLAAKKAADK